MRAQFFQAGIQASGWDSFFFFCFFGQAPGPDILHLLAAVYLLHQLIIEKVMGFPIRLLRPENGFRGMSEAAAGQIRRRIGFLPGDVVDDFITLLLQGHADGINIMERS